jgi:RNA polymerase sigma-70 factor (ECF subfamily)
MASSIADRPLVVHNTIVPLPDSDPSDLIRGFVATEYARVVATVGMATGEPDRAEDAVQEALIRVLSNGHRPERLGAWVTVVATNVVRSAQRRRTAESKALDRSYDPPSDDEAIRVSDEVTLREVVSRLPERQRTIVLMYYYLDAPIAEIASAMEISEGTVKTQLHRARATLANALGEEAGE